MAYFEYLFQGLAYAVKEKKNSISSLYSQMFKYCVKRAVSVPA